MKYLAFMFAGISLSIGSCSKSDVDQMSTKAVSTSLFEALHTYDTATIHSYVLKGVPLAETFAGNIKFVKLDRFKGMRSDIILIDTLHVQSFGDFMNLYFKHDTTYYKLVSGYARDSVGRIKIWSIRVDNLSEYCDKKRSEPYKPNYNFLPFRAFTWTSNASRTEFIDGSVRLQNNLGTDITYLKFRLDVKVDDELVFSQTIETRNKIYSGDIAVIDIPGLRNYYVKQGIIEPHVSYVATPLEMEPKDLRDCEEIEMLKEVEQKM